MIKNKFSVSAVTFAAGAMLLASGLSALPASAAKTPAKTATQLAAIIARSDKAIEARITDLNTLATRVGEMKNVSATEQSAISSEVQTQITGLTALKAKIDADTDVATAKTDEKSITADFRIYALVIPQGHLLAAADRIATITNTLNVLGAKLQTRIAAAKAAGKDTTALETALTDMGNKMNDAATQAQSAYAKISSLIPDKGDKTVAASNKAALVAARADKA